MMGNVFSIAVEPLDRVGQGLVGFALLFTHLNLSELAHA